MSTPSIPPRPQKTKEAATLGSEQPKIPPRPKRNIERSLSPNGERYARSPLNEPRYMGPLSSISKSSLYASESANASASSLQRPPSVSLPSIGQEGNEYDGAFNAADELGTSPTQLRSISNDLKLHAPKPSLPVPSAKQRVATVTRTDSGQAAAHGIGKASGADDNDPTSRSLKAKASFASQTSNSDRRQSVDSEHGIPEIGQRVPMYPHAGDVQAPSPAPHAAQYPVGVEFHNDGSKPKHHGRRPSANIPADAYGRYGHGVAIPHDRFERAYYEKHPELFKKELGQYGEGRPEWAMSSEDLNKIVRETASRGAGFGTSPAVMSAPSEQLGFQASEEYTSRMSSPRPPVPRVHATHSNASDLHVDSPLKHESSSLETTSKADIENTLSRSLAGPSTTSLASETEDDIIHVEDPGRRYNKIYGGDNSMQSAEDLGIHTEAQDNDDDDYGAPILASDEVAKEPFGWELLPAVSPMHERRASGNKDSPYHFRSGSQTSQNGSRPSSRPGSIHGNVPNLRLPEGTPLEDLEEYEPLFPEEEKKPAGLEKPLTAADKFKRPELKNRKFPSQDVWEDTPNSLQYTATVSTPQLPEETEDSPKAQVAETDAQAFARRQEELAERESRDPGGYQAREKKPWAQHTQLAAETRPNNLKQRFPSRDIWEDTPDSLQLQTTVSSAQSEEDILSPSGESPKAGMYLQKAPGLSPLGSEDSVAAKPQIPSRPAKSQPTIPDRPQRTRQLEGAQTPAKSKPQVPARPSKPITRDSSEGVPLSTVASNSSAKSISSDSGAAAAAKSKPPPPARPIGSKIAALQGGFMADLNKRLQLGAQAPKKEEPAAEEQEEEKEKAPLIDARKGRARGPARRAPGKSPAPAASETAELKSSLGFSMAMTSWEIDPEDDFVHVSSSGEEKETSIPTKAAESETPTLATNIAGEPVHEPSEIEHGAKDDVPAVHEDERREEPEEAETEEKDVVVDEPEEEQKDQEREAIEKSIDAPVMPGSFLTPGAIEDEDDLSASTATLKPSKEEE